MRRAAALVFCAMTLLAACSGDEGSPTVAEPPIDYGTTEPPTDTSGIQAAECQNLRSGPQAPIEIDDFRFDPPCAEVTTSQGFELQNNGSNLHNFSIEGTGIDVDIQSEQTNNTENPGLDADTYTFFCKYHRAQGMEGELRVSSG